MGPGDMTRLRYASRRQIALGLAATLLCVTGCSSDEAAVNEPTVDAAGTVTYKGQPLEYHRVMVHPEGHRVGSGISDAQGKFVLGTNSAGDGAVEGKHKVSVVYVGPPVDPNVDAATLPPPPAPKVKIPAKYNKPETSGVTVEIPTGGNEDLKIDLQ